MRSRDRLLSRRDQSIPANTKRKVREHPRKDANVEVITSTFSLLLLSELSIKPYGKAKAPWKFKCSCDHHQYEAGVIISLAFLSPNKR